MYTDKSIFLIKKEKNLLSIWKFQKKLIISSKTNLIVNLYIVKKCVKAEKKQQNKTKKHTHTKGGFQCLSAPIIQIDSIYRKDENYYFKKLLEKH